MTESSERRSSSGTRRRHSRTVHSCGMRASYPRARSSSARTNAQSKRALCATNTRPASAAVTWSAMAAKRGASATRAAVIPVSCSMRHGIGRPGFTSDSKASSTRGPSTCTTAISVMRSSPRARIPVVSTSTTAKRTSPSGTPSHAGSGTTLQHPSNSDANRGSAPRSAVASRSATAWLARWRPMTSRTMSSGGRGPSRR